MEAEMALFEQEVLGAPGPAPGDPLAPPPILQPIISTNTYQQVSSDILGGASGLLPAVIPAPTLQYRAKTTRECSVPAALPLWAVSPPHSFSWEVLCSPAQEDSALLAALCSWSRREAAATIP
ncbi:RNA-binding protein 42-like isoform X2 [Chiroxiphia lanceolata]|uniref:RNA-binding protein 42-like isoform X2 n=1 Tax=Chiroxiphia lanceolata TaxID=296741 RepID=UPI0013CEFD9B|nr:RNA-binding protein 42-like isoform X2 [Chiroxiphia lanceolata]